MKALLNFELAPLGSQWGFFEAPVRRVADALVTWRRGHTKAVSMQPVHAPLRAALQMVEPLTGLPERELLLETRSPWTAYFDNSALGGDAAGPASYLALQLRCRSLALTVVPNTIQGTTGQYGAVQFELFGPEKTDWLNYERSLAASNDGGRWVFIEEGKMLPFEKPERYLAKKIKDRFTSEMLEEYCAALGLDIYNEDFYGPNGVLVTVVR